VSIHPDLFTKVITTGIDPTRLYATKLTPEINQYNRLSNKHNAISVKTECKPLNFGWTFNQAYQRIDVEDVVFDALDVELKGLDKNKQRLRLDRTLTELKLFKKHQLMTVLQLIVYIIDTFERNSVVWGVGRGSSVSSYVLYLLGLHDIDSVEWELPIQDFLRDS
jgi:DNA polymerase III alpha subunit